MSLSRQMLYDDDDEIEFITLKVFNDMRTMATMLEYLREEEEEEKEKKSNKGSMKGCQYIRRGRFEGHENLMKDYFGESPIYADDIFRKKFRMKREFFLTIVDAVESHDSYFIQKFDATQLRGLSKLQKVAAAIHQLIYGLGFHVADKYFTLGNSTASVCLKRFCKAMIEMYENDYLLKTQNLQTVDEATSDNIERNLSILKGRFALIQKPTRFVKKIDLERVTKTCIILYNMILENEKDQNLGQDYDAHLLLSPSSRRGESYRLQEDLIKYMW